MTRSIGRVERQAGNRQRGLALRGHRKALDVVERRPGRAAVGRLPDAPAS